MAVIVTTLLLALGLAGLVLSAADRQPTAFTAITALSCLAISALGAWEQRRLDAAGAARAKLASSAARHAAYIWIFGALSLLLVYGFILVWREWLVFSVGMLVVGGLCYALSMLFASDAERGRHDVQMLSLGRMLNIAQVAGMVIAMVGLLVDGKMKVAFLANRSDWAANSTFFFGAFAIAILGAWALVTDGRAAARDVSATNAGGAE